MGETDGDPARDPAIVCRGERLPWDGRRLSKLADADGEGEGEPRRRESCTEGRRVDLAVSSARRESTADGRRTIDGAGDAHELPSSTDCLRSCPLPPVLNFLASHDFLPADCSGEAGREETRSMYFGPDARGATAGLSELMLSPRDRPPPFSVMPGKGASFESA